VRQVERGLIISDSPKAMKFFEEFLEDFGLTSIHLAATPSDGLRALLDDDPEVVIINGPIRGESGASLAEEIAAANRCQVILFVKAEYMEDMTSRVEKSGVICVSKPISKNMFWGALSFAEAAQNRIAMANRTIQKLQKKLEEMRLVSKAKSILMQEKQMTEPEAHHYIEKTAMDRRVPRGQIAEEIIDFYQD
jgi:response regulator NasT